MQLPSSARAELAEKLVESLELPEKDELRSAWADEAIRRRDEIRAGKVQPISGDEVLGEARRMVGR